MLNYASLCAKPTLTPCNGSWSAKNKRTKNRMALATEARATNAQKNPANPNKVEPIHLTQEPNPLRIEIAELVTLKPLSPQPYDPCK